MTHSAKDWRSDPQVEDMQRLYDQDPASFHRTFGARGLIQLGIYRSEQETRAGRRPRRHHSPMTTTTKGTDVPKPEGNIVHEFYCQPRPKASEVRTERYHLPRPGEDGVSTVRQVEVHRCIECGAATYDGTPEREIGGPPVMARERRHV